MTRYLDATYESSEGERHRVSLDCITGVVTFPSGTPPEAPEVEGVDYETLFVKTSSLTSALDTYRNEDNDVVVYGSNFETVQQYAGTLRQYFLMCIHEKVSELEFQTYVPWVLYPGKDIKEESESYLLYYYGEGNGTPTTDYGEYSIEFNNYSVGYVTYKTITKEEYDVCHALIG